MHAISERISGLALSASAGRTGSGTTTAALETVEQVPNVDPMPLLVLNSDHWL